MPAFISMILGGLITITGSLVGRVLLALGLGVATYTGITSTVGWLKSQVVNNLMGLPADILNLVAFMNVGESISIIISAISARFIINGVQSDTLKKWILN